MKKLKFWQMMIILMSGRKFRDKYITRLLLKVVLEDFIKDGEKAIIYKNGGLCYHVNRFSRDFVRESRLADFVSANYIANQVEQLFKGFYKEWPDYSGNCRYPVYDKFETYILEEHLSSLLCSHKESQEIYIGPVSPKWQYLLNTGYFYDLGGFSPNHNIMKRCSGVDGLYKGRQLELRLDLAKFVHGRL